MLSESLTCPAVLWGPPPPPGWPLTSFPGGGPYGEEDAGESKNFCKGLCSLWCFGSSMMKEYKVLLFLRRLINEESPGGRTEGLNQQIPNLGSRCLGDLFIYSACVRWVTCFHKPSYGKGTPPLRGFYMRERTVSSAPPVPLMQSPWLWIPTFSW